MAAARTDQAHVVYRLLDAGADALPVDWNDSTALDYAQSDFSYRLLLAAALPGPDPEQRAAADLLRRLRLEPGELLEELEQQRLDTYYQRQLGYGRLRLVLTALGTLEAGTERRRAVLTGVLQRGALSWAAGEVVALLVGAGADPDARDCPVRTRGPGGIRCTRDKGMTPLMLAAACGFSGLERIVERSADPSLVDWEGRTAADYRRLKPLTSCDPFALRWVW